MIKFLRRMGWILGILNIISGIISIVQATKIVSRIYYTQMDAVATSLIFSGCVAILLGVFVIGIVVRVCDNDAITKKHEKEIDRLWDRIHELEDK